MSCFAGDKYYSPNPTRAWSRVQNACTFNTSTDIVDTSSSLMLQKGNVLQYKKNSSNITRAQKYAHMAKGTWTNRTNNWAVQSGRGYTNPNTNEMMRAGNVHNIAISSQTGNNLGPTTLPITCPANNIPIYNTLPPSYKGEVVPPIIPPPYPQNPSDYMPIVPSETPAPPIVIQNGGVLICGTRENVCTGKIINNTRTGNNCQLTTASDVPGPIQELCWIEGTPTWYPKTRYVMSNSTSQLIYTSNLINPSNCTNYSNNRLKSLDNMYDDVGESISNILHSFVNGNDDLKILINYENYNILADKLYSHFNGDNNTLENFRNLLVSAIEGVKHSDNRIKEQEQAYFTLLQSYNSLLNNTENSSDAMILEARTSVDVTAQIKPEILEYISRGYKIVDNEGNLIPLDMDVLSKIREDLN